MIVKDKKLAKPINEQKIKDLTEKIRLIEQNYGITNTKLLPHQQEIMDGAKETKRAWVRDRYITVPKNKYVVMQGGNGVGKSFTLYYLTALYAMGRQCSKYSLPYIGAKKNIFIVTQSNSNIRDYVEPYLLWPWSPCRIPPELIKKVSRWPEAIKSIELINWCKITLKTVEQWQKRLVGSNPDLLVIDEPVEKDEVWNELLARLRDPKAQMLYWFTPINGYNASYYFLYEQLSKKVRNTTFLRVYTSTENTYQDHTTLDGMTEKERKMRLYGQFTPLTGLVYNEFEKHNNTITNVSPKSLWPCRYYAGLDFGTSHPFWFVAVAVDEDWHHYVFDSATGSDVLLKDIADRIKDIKKKWGVEFEYIVADTAGKRERLELKQYGISTVPADKWAKGANGESNRRASIMRMNQLLHDGNLLIGEEQIELIKEFSTHAYAKSGMDGKVIKENDDLLDALRYCIFSIKQPKLKTADMSAFEEKWGVNWRDVDKWEERGYSSY